MQTTTRRGPGRPKGTLTLEVALASYLLDRAALLDPPEDDGRTWPSTKYQHGIIAFCYEVLGCVDRVTSRGVKVPGITRTQKKVLLAIQRAAHGGAGRVAVKAGRKVGKTWVAAAAALWFYCSFPRAHVWLTAPKIDQVDDLVWIEIREAWRKAIVPIDGVPATSSETGLVASDDRSIKGRVARTKEAATGRSGRQFYIIDEASGVSADTLEAIEGNRAGGHVPILMIANPTRTDGEFFEAFHKKKALYGGGDPEKGPFTISSEESPNFIAGEDVIEGMATRDWIQEMETVHGRDSAFFRHNVLGEFAEGEFGKIIKLSTIVEAQKRFDGPVEEKGSLVIGLDVAGAGPAGDKTVFAPRRGNRVRIHDHKGLDEAAILAHLNGYIALYELDAREEVLVVVDADGEVGARVVGHLRAAALDPKARFKVFGVRSGEWAEREPRAFAKTRDELWAWCSRWLVAGGAIPDDAELAQELHAPSWHADDKNRQYATKKRDGANNLIKILGRSPDKADAVCLSTWVEGHEREPNTAQYEQGAIEDLRDAIITPYDSEFDPWKGQR